MSPCTVRKINRRREQLERVQIYRERAWSGGMTQAAQVVRLSRCARFEEADNAEFLALIPYSAP
jgi:hypothetical protein